MDLEGSLRMRRVPAWSRESPLLILRLLFGLGGWEFMDGACHLGDKWKPGSVSTIPIIQCGRKIGIVGSIYDT